MRAFTLIELLLVIAIVALLVAMTVPAIGSVRLAARHLVFASNQRQVAAAILSYAGSNNGLTPTMSTAEGGWAQSAAALLDRDDLLGTWTDEKVGRSIFHDPIDTSIHVRPGYNRRTFNLAMNGNTSWRATGTGCPVGGAWWAGGWTLTPRPVGAMHRRLASVTHPSELLLLCPGPRSGNFAIGSEGGYSLRLSSYDWLTYSSGPAEFLRYGNRGPVAFIDGHVQTITATFLWSELHKDRWTGDSRFIDSGGTNP